jgi:hypothetical protein
MITSFQSLPNSAISRLCILEAVGFYLHEAFKRKGRYLNFNAGLMKKCIIYTRKDKIMK